MVLSSKTKQDQTEERITINSYAETLTCKFCGGSYISRGKHDPGYCKECAMVFLKGPLDGKKVGEIRDYTGSETETS